MLEKYLAAIKNAEIVARYGSGQVHLIVAVPVYSLATEHYPCKALVPCDKYVYKADGRRRNRLYALL